MCRGTGVDDPWNRRLIVDVIDEKEARPAVSGGHRIQKPATLMAFVVALSLSACSSNSQPDGLATGGRLRPTSSTGSGGPAASPTLLPRVSAILHPPPKTCEGPAPKSKTVTSNYGALYGRRPAWGGFYADLDLKTRAFHAPDAPRTSLGWRVKVLWIMDPKQNSRVKLGGLNPSTGELIWFELSDSPATAAPVLDPAQPENLGDGGWKEYPSYLYFPSSGCYVLEAEWPGGDWQIGFGFGR
jgi:hypothetical protein